MSPSNPQGFDTADRPRRSAAWGILTAGLASAFIFKVWLRALVDSNYFGSSEAWPYAYLLGEAIFAACPTFVGLTLVFERWLTKGTAGRIQGLIASRGAPWFWAFTSVVLSGLIAALVYDFSPITNGDEYAYEFQARLFATGRISAPAPPVPEAFSTLARVIHDGRWFAMAFPGHPLMLALGSAVGMPWLSVAIVSFCSVLALGAVGRRLLGPTGGGVATALAALSPHVLYMQGSLLSQPTIALALLVLILLTLQLKERPRVGTALGIGLAWAALFLVRPPTAATMGLTWVAWIMWHLKSELDTRLWLRLVSRIALAGSVGVIAYYGYNALVTGVWGGSIYGMAMRGDPMGLAEWRPARKAIESVANLVRFNFFLFGWPLSLLFCVQWCRRGFPGRELRFLALSTIPLCGLYALYFAGHYWYWHELYIPATLVTAAMVASILDRGAPTAGAWNARRVLAVLLAGWGCSALFVIPFLNAQYAGFIDPRAELLRGLPVLEAPQLIVVQSLPPVRDLPRRRFNGLNDPDLGNPRLFAIDTGGDCVARLEVAFPDRELILYGYDASSGRMRTRAYKAPLSSRQVPRTQEGE